MSGKILDDSEVELFEKIKQDYFQNKELNYISLSEKHGVPYGKLFSIARKDKWKKQRDSRRKEQREKRKKQEAVSGKQHEKEEIKKGEREDSNAKSVINGGSTVVESEALPVSDLNGKQKGGSPFSESDTPVNKQVEILRNDAFELASSAAESLASKEDWNPKDFDLLVGTFAKVVGVQMKMEGNEDGIDRLFSELTDTEVFRTPSAKSEEGADES